MDGAPSNEQSENTNPNQGNYTPGRPQKIKFSNKSWKSPRLFGFVLAFVVIGGYVIIRSFAATSAETKVWNTTAEWNTGTLSDVAVSNNDVTLASAGGTTSGGAGPSPTYIANLSNGRPAVASSVQRGSYQGTYYNLVPSNAFDGNTATRWGSDYSGWDTRNNKTPTWNAPSNNNQWIYVNLGAVYNISEVKLNWEAAYGKAYDIQVSNNAKTWTTIYSTTTGTGGVNDLTGLSGSGQYVRMLGIQRGTQYGYSLWEMDVYGTPSSTTTPQPTPVSTYDGTGSITLDYDAGTSVSWTSLTGQATTPSGTAVSYQARTSSDNSTWSAWNSNIASLASSRYIQVQADLSTNNTSATPSLSSLTLGYNTPVTAPTATLLVGSTTVTSGQPTLLTWSSTNATSCTASGSWSGAQPTSGTQSITPTQTSTYSLTCSGTGGTSSASSVTVTVSAASTPPPVSSGIAPSNVSMPAVPSGWYTVFSSDFNTPEKLGNVGEGGFPGWYGPYCGGTGDTSNSRGEGSGIWQCSATVTVGPNNSGDGTAVPANVLDIWQHVQNGVPMSAVLIPDCTGQATNGCSTTPYNADQGLTSECVSFEYRVVNAVRGYKMVPLLWNDPNLPYAEVDSPETDFGNNTVTMAMYFPTYPSGDSQYIDPNFSIANGVYSYNLNWSADTPSNINLSNWTEWETCRTPGELKVYIDGVLAFDKTNGETFTQWGDQPGVIQVPQSSMHWVLQTETSTNIDEQPASSAADHVQFNWVQITAPEN